MRLLLTNSVTTWTIFQNIQVVITLSFPVQNWKLLNYLGALNICLSENPVCVPVCSSLSQGCNRFVCIFHIMAFHKDEQDTEHLSELIDTSFTSTIFTLKVDFLYQ